VVASQARRAAVARRRNPRYLRTQHANCLIMGKGGCMAMEDAYMMAESLRRYAGLAGVQPK
jgi:hypothetical protein